MRFTTVRSFALLLLTTVGRAEEPPATGSIHGVTLIDGRPGPARIEVRHDGRRDPRLPPGWRSTVPDASVWLESFERKVVKVLRSGPDGRFALDGLAVGGHGLTVRGKQGERGAANVALELPGQRADVSIRLVGGEHEVRGVATDHAGRPFRGVLLASLLRQSHVRYESVHLSVETAEDGSFSVAGLPDGEISFTAVLGPGWRARFRPLEVPRTEPLRLVVDDRVREVKGRVTDEEGKPVVGAFVEVSGDQSRELISGRITGKKGFHPISDLSRVTRVVRTDADGRFRASVPGFDLGYDVIGEGYLRATKREVNRDALPEGGLRIRLTGAARVTGRVVFPGNVDPVAGVPVLAVTTGKPVGRAHAFTDDEGRYVIEGLRPGRTTVFVAGAGWIARDVMKVVGRGPDPLSVTLAAGETDSLDVAVVRAGSVEGRLVDADGEDVAGAKVEALPGGRSPPPRLLRDMTVAASGPDGRFRIDRLVPGASYVLRSRPEGHLTAKTEPLRAVGGKAVRAKLDLPRSHRLTVEVVDTKTGAPVFDAVVAASCERDHSREATDADGVARIGPFRPGTAKISVRHPAYLTPEKSTEARVDGKRGTVRISLVRGQVLLGKCVTLDGKPVGSGQIMLGLNPGSNTVHKSTTVRADGTFRIVGLPHGTYEVDLRIEGWHDERPYRKRTRVETGSGEVQIVVEPLK